MATNRHTFLSLLSLLAAPFVAISAHAQPPVATEAPTATAAPVAPPETPVAPTVETQLAPPSTLADPVAPAEAAPFEPSTTAPELAAVPAPEPAPEKKPEWYETLKIRGYTQFRYNRLPTFDTNEALINDQGDKYIGAGSGFGIRRARVIIYGDVHPQVAVYLQTDFASAIGDQNHVAIVRDWYADVALDSDKEFRFRIGQSKVPFGFENLQSSQNRLAFDRNDAINSAVKDERDLGVFAYWAPAPIRKRFKDLVDHNLKGSGDYGVVGVGIYNGQTANRFDRNDNLHVVGRISYPFQFGDQFVELGVGGYTGLYQISTLNVEGGTEYFVKDTDNNLRDARAAVSAVVYPQPFGLQAEYNIGKGPQQLAGTSTPTVIGTHDLAGGYVQAMYKIDEPFGTVSLIPYARGTMYEGGKKFEVNTPRYDIKELELGAEWQIIKPIEVTLAYMFSDRTSSKAPYAQQKGQIARIQLQVNY
jgi:Phosphate-selective porin O and P